MTTMHSELTNLLPRSSMRTLRREYFLRLFTIGFLLATVVVAIHAVLLFPAYLYVHAAVVREQTALNHVSDSSSTAQERQVTSQISQVKSDIAYLGRLSSQPTASNAIRAIIAVPHPGITLSGFTYTAPSGTSKNAKLDVTGTASTRDSLRTYTASLQQLSYVSSADLPISAYAKESAIPFTITLTGSLLP